MATMHHLRLQPTGTSSSCWRHSRRGLRPARATSEGASSQEDPQVQKPVEGSVGATADIAFPKSGLFSIADPKAEVYSKAGERFDPTKKGGRFKPEFIWQTNWQEQLKRQEDLERQQEAYRQRQKAGGITGGTGPGVVSFSRLGSLNNLDVDLTEQLAAAQERRRAQQQAAAAAERQQPGASSSGSSSTAAAIQPQQQQQRQQQQGRSRSRAAASPSYQYKDLPTKNEARRFKRATRASGAGTVPTISAVGSASPEEAAARAATAAAERARYEALKLEFQAWAIGLGFVGTAGCWALYGNDVAISYALGASGGLTYLRLLSRTVDAVGDASTGGVNTAIGQPRLLIPVLLALTYNRWNVLYAEQYGYHLDLYGMLVGFFTYKLAVLGRQGLALLNELSEGGSSGSSGSSSGAGGEQEGGDAMSLDRIFVRKVMSE